MDSDDTHASLPVEALARKRERDKQNQRRKRQREREHTASLEARIRQLEHQLESATARSHHDHRSQGPAPGCHRANSTGGGTGQRREAVGRHPAPTKVAAAAAATPACDDASPPLERLAPEEPPRRSSDGTLVWASPAADSVISMPSTCLVAYTPGRRLSSEEPRLSQSDSQSPPQLQASGSGRARESGTPLEVTISVESLGTLLATPAWLRLPALTFSPSPAPRLLIRNEVFETAIRRLRADPDFVSTSPKVPKVMDLLFGGSRNELANLVSSELTPHALLPPERFATAWILYIMLRVCFPCIPSPHPPAPQTRLGPKLPSRTFCLLTLL